MTHLASWCIISSVVYITHYPNIWNHLHVILKLELASDSSPSDYFAADTCFLLQAIILLPTYVLHGKFWFETMNATGSSS